MEALIINHVHNFSTMCALDTHPHPQSPRLFQILEIQQWQRIKVSVIMCEAYLNMIRSHHHDQFV